MPRVHNSLHFQLFEFFDPTGTDTEALRSARDTFRDTAFAWPTWAWARLQSTTGKGKVYVYYFSHRPPYPSTPQYQGWGAAHAAEISFVFGNFSAAMKPTAADCALSDDVSSYWVNFAKTGDPNGKGLPQWPAFSGSNARVMNLDDHSKAVAVPSAFPKTRWGSVLQAPRTTWASPSCVTRIPPVLPICLPATLPAVRCARPRAHAAVVLCERCSRYSRSFLKTQRGPSYPPACSR
jgi:hypothetical protein